VTVGEGPEGKLFGTLPWIRPESPETGEKGRGRKQRSAAAEIDFPLTAEKPGSRHKR